MNVQKANISINNYKYATMSANQELLLPKMKKVYVLLVTLHILSAQLVLILINVQNALMIILFYLILGLVFFCNDNCKICDANYKCLECDGLLNLHMD